MATSKKISALNTARSSDLTAQDDIIPIVNSGETKKITVNELLGSALHITASGNVSASGTGSFGYLKADVIEGTDPSGRSELKITNASLNLTGSLTASAIQTTELVGVMAGNPELIDGVHYGTAKNTNVIVFSASGPPSPQLRITNGGSLRIREGSRVGLRDYFSVFI